MSARSSVQVKAILLKDGEEEGRTEIRRFRMDNDRERFQSLVTRVQSVFNIDSATHHCTLCWKDDEDDLIQFSTEEELRYALENNTDDTFRFYVIVREGAMEEEEVCEMEETEGGVEMKRMKRVTWDPEFTCTDPCTVTRITCPGMPRCGPMGKKGRKAMDKMFKIMKEAKHREFEKVRQQVPGQFRSWVRQFVHTWYTQGADAALTTSKDKMPEGMSPDFPQWLLTFLNNHHPHTNTATSGGQDGETGLKGTREGEMETAPEGVPPVYFQWLRLFVPRFFWRHGHGDGRGHGHGHGSPGRRHGSPGRRHGSPARCERDENRGCQHHSPDGKSPKGQGKHGCHRWRGGRHGSSGRSSGSDSDSGEKFEKVRQQVPGQFRSWVRQFVHTWYTQGADAALTTSKDKMPEGMSPDFPQWLLTFLNNHHPHTNTATSGGQDGETGLKGMREGETETAPEGVPPVYFQWLRLFVPRFFRRHGHGDGRGHGRGHGSPDRCGRAGKHGFRHDSAERGCYKGCGKHGGHGKRGGKHGATSSSSESDTDSGEKPWQSVPKEFRKYTRIIMKKLHKGKEDNPKLKTKATEAGLSEEVQAFVAQILLEWHSKLSSQPPQAVAMEMMGAERTLPSGLEREHFLWLCRFMVRWHRRHAGKCDVMASWSSGETSTDDTSGDEAMPCGRPDHRPWPRGDRPHCRAFMKIMKGHPRGMMGRRHPHFAMHPGHPQGMMGCPHLHFATRPGMDFPCFSPPGGPRCGAKRCCRMNRSPDRDGSKRQKDRESRQTTDDMVKHVTEGVKRM